MIHDHCRMKMYLTACANVKDTVQPAYPRSLTRAGFSLTPYLESFTPAFGLGKLLFFTEFLQILHSGTHTFSKVCLWDSYFQNPSENPAGVFHFRLNSLHILGKLKYHK